MNPIIKTKPNVTKGASITALYSYQGSKCFYCNRHMRFMSYQPNDPTRRDGYTLDHLFPRSLGFAAFGNTVLAHRKCNERKENRMPTNKEIVKAWELYQKIGREFIATIIYP